MRLCGFEVGLDRPFFLIAGPCVVESEQLQMDVAGRLREITSELGIPFIFKSSYDKANRSAGFTFRGPGMERGLEILATVKRELGVPLLTDVHSEAEIPAVAEYKHPRDPDAPGWGSARWRRIGSESGEGRRRYHCCGVTVPLTEPVMLELLDIVAGLGMSRITIAQLSVLVLRRT